MTTLGTKEVAREHIEELAKLNVFRWLMWVFFNWGVIVGTLVVAGMVNHLLLYIAAVLIIGNRAHALALLGHDGAHGLVHKNLIVNDLLAGLFCFWPFGVGVGGYRRFHFQHHKHVGTEKDPELHHKRLAKPNWDLPATIQRIIRRTGLDLVGLGFKEVFLIFYFIGKPAKPIDVIGPALLWIVVLAFIWITQWWWILLVWFIALGTCFWATF